jgi:tetratricopeptide (TPR) repeat protein
MVDGDTIQHFLTKVSNLTREGLISWSKTALVILVAMGACAHLVLSWQAGNIGGMQAFVLVLTLFIGEIAAVQNIRHFEGVNFLILLAIPLAVWAAVQILGQVGSRSGRAADVRRRMKQYQAALQRDPGNVAAHVFLGDSYVKLGRRRQAAVEYQAALALDPHDYQARFRLERLQRA